MSIIQNNYALPKIMIMGKYTNWINPKNINLTWNKNGISFSVKKIIKTMSIDTNWKLIGRYSFRKKSFSEYEYVLYLFILIIILFYIMYLKIWNYS